MCLKKKVFRRIMISQNQPKGSNLKQSRRSNLNNRGESKPNKRKMPKRRNKFESR